MNDCVICFEDGFYMPSTLRATESYIKLSIMIDGGSPVVAVWKRKKLQPKISFDGGKKYLDLVCHPMLSFDFNCNGLLEQEDTELQKELNVQAAQQIINEGK